MEEQVFSPWALPRNIAEAMSGYVIKYGLKPYGPHRPLADELLHGINRECETCGGTGLRGTYGAIGWVVCPECHGLGSVYTISLEDLLSRRQKVLAQYPDAEIPNWRPGIATEAEYISNLDVRSHGPKTLQGEPGAKESGQLELFGDSWAELDRYDFELDVDFEALMKGLISPWFKVRRVLKREKES